MSTTTYAFVEKLEEYQYFWTEKSIQHDLFRNIRCYYLIYPEYWYTPTPYHIYSKNSATLPTAFTLSVGTPYLLTIPVLKFEIVHSTTF